MPAFFLCHDRLLLKNVAVVGSMSNDGDLYFTNTRRAVPSE